MTRGIVFFFALLLMALNPVPNNVKTLRVSPANYPPYDVIFAELLKPEKIATYSARGGKLFCFGTRTYGEVSAEMRDAGYYYATVQELIAYFHNVPRTFVRTRSVLAPETNVSGHARMVSIPVLTDQEHGDGNYVRYLHSYGDISPQFTSSDELCVLGMPD